MYTKHLPFLLGMVLLIAFWAVKENIADAFTSQTNNSILLQILLAISEGLLALILPLFGYLLFNSKKKEITDEKDKIDKEKKDRRINYEKRSCDDISSKLCLNINKC